MSVMKVLIMSLGILLSTFSLGRDVGALPRGVDTVAHFKELRALAEGIKTPDANGTDWSTGVEVPSNSTTGAYPGDAEGSALNTLKTWVSVGVFFAGAAFGISLVFCCYCCCKCCPCGSLCSATTGTPYCRF